MLVSSALALSHASLALVLIFGLGSLLCLIFVFCFHVFRLSKSLRRVLRLLEKCSTAVGAHELPQKLLDCVGQAYELKGLGMMGTRAPPPPPSQHQTLNAPVEYVAASAPQYQTLAAVDQPAAINKSDKPKTEKKKEVSFKPSDDENYQTMGGLDNKVFEKDAKSKKKTPVESDDVNYQTLAGMDNQVFDNKPTFKPADDQNYQTMAGVDDKVFEKKKQ